MLRRVALPVLLLTTFVAAPAAQAETSSHTVLLTLGSVGDADLEIYRQVDGGATATDPRVPGDRIRDLTSSADGGRYAYVDDVTANDPTNYNEVVVRDAGGALVREIDRKMTHSSSVFFDREPHLSPDGTRLVFNQGTRFGTVLYLADVTTGALTEIPVPINTYRSLWGFISPTFFIVSDGSVDGPGGTLGTLSVSGGQMKPAPALPSADFSVSPDGTRIAYSVSAPTGNADLVASIQVASLSVSAAGDVAISNVKTVAGGGLNTQPVWTPDGTTLRFLHASGLGGDRTGDIGAVPADGSSGPVITATAVDEDSLAVVRTDTVAPAAPVFKPISLRGTTSVVGWTRPAGTDLSGYRLTRTFGDQATTFDLPAGATSVTDTGLTLGRTYSYAITAFDHSGNTSPVATRQMTALAPTVTFPSPTSTSYVGQNFRIGLPAVGTYNLNYSENRTAYRSICNRCSGPSRVITGHAGSSYSFGIQVFDAFGNASPTAYKGYALVPYDQTVATFVGTRSTRSASDRYLGSVTVLGARGGSATFTTSGTLFQLVGEKCTGCGVVDIYVDGRRVAAADTYASRRIARAVLVSVPMAAGRHTIKVVVRGTAGRPSVIVDGFAVQR